MTNALNSITMSFIIEIENNDAMELSEHIKKGLHHMGKAMGIVEEMCEGEMGFRGRGGNQGSGSGSRMGMREDDADQEYDMYGSPMQMRRMRNSRGRFM